MKKLYFLLPILGLVAACTQPESAKRLVEQQGYSDVQAGGYDWLSCSEDDTYRTHFVATAPNGDRVGGTVCEGMFGKGKTVRFD